MTNDMRDRLFASYLRWWRSLTEAARDHQRHNTDVSVLEPEGVTTTRLALPFTTAELDAGQLDEDL